MGAESAFNWGSAIQGIGSLAGAWGSYESAKKANKLQKEQFDYEKSKDALALTKINEHQKNVDDAFSDFTLDGKKKKKADGSDIIDNFSPSATV